MASLLARLIFDTVYARVHNKNSKGECLTRTHSAKSLHILKGAMVEQRLYLL